MKRYQTVQLPVPVSTKSVPFARIFFSELKKILANEKLNNKKKKMILWMRGSVVGYFENDVVVLYGI